MLTPSWGADGFDSYNVQGVASHHIAAGIIGVLGGIFHLTVRPSYGIYRALRIGNIETVLASSIAVEAFGPTRYMWDLGLYNEATETIRLGDGTLVYSVRRQS